MGAALDLGPLLAEPSAEAVARYRAEAADRSDVARAVGGDRALVSVLMAAVAALVVGALVVLTDILDQIVGLPLAAAPRILIVAGIGAAIVGGVVAWIVVKRRANWRRWTRLDALARANGLVFAPHGGTPTYPGAIFGVGSSREMLEHLTSDSGRFIDYGSTRYTVGSGKNRSTKTWGFLALQLDRALPHMVLDASANNGLFGTTGLPTEFRRDQVLALEGDFNEHFTLYCPREYERDALYVFTPDLMALLIDNAAPFDVEIVDRWLFVYSPRAFDLLDPAVHQRLERIIDTVGEKTLSQTDRYVDERIGEFAPNIVAPSGQRLRRRLPVAAIVVGVAVALIWVVPQLIEAMARLGG